MTEEQKRRLEQKLWDIANTLRGKMDADEFRDYILGFIFYKYLSEKMHRYANSILAEDGVEYLTVHEGTADGDAMLEAVRDDAVEQLGYFLKPSELFSEVAKRGNAKGKAGPRLGVKLRTANGRASAWLLTTRRSAKAERFEAR